jgi:hypothetical protein
VVPDLSLPQAVTTVSPDDVARLERLAAIQRAELARLSLALRTAMAKAGAAEAEAKKDVVGGPEPLLEVVDATIRTAADDGAQKVDAATKEAGLVLAVANRLARELLRSAGIDPADVPTVEPRTDGLRPGLRRPASGEQLWRQVRSLDDTGPLPIVRPQRPAAGHASVEDPGPAPGPNEDPTPSSPAPPPPPAATREGSASPAAPAHEVRIAAPVASTVSTAPRLASSEAPGPGVDDAGQAYARFWSKVPEQRPVVDRLRLRPARGVR